jgi:hypothetical protein
MKFDSSSLSNLALEHQIPFGIIKSMDEVFSTTAANDLIREETQGTTSTKRVTQLAFKWK